MSNLVKKATKTLHVQHTFYGGNVVCVPVHFFLLPLTFPLVATTTSHFPNALQNVHVLIPTKLVSFVFHLSLQLFLCYPSQCTSVDIKIKLKERFGFVIVVFYLYKFGQLCYLLPKRVGAKFHPSLHEGADIHTDDFVRTKISWMH